MSLTSDSPDTTIIEPQVNAPNGLEATGSTAPPLATTSPQTRTSDPEWLPQLERFIEERVDVEALTAALERLSSTRNLDQRIQQAVSGLRRQVQAHAQILDSIRGEIRNALLELEILKRAITSVAPAAVDTQPKDRELVLKVLPPSRPNGGTGVRVSPSTSRPAVAVDCGSRIHICRAACCRVFNVYLTPQEVTEPQYDWNTNQPYTLVRTPAGCTHLESGTCRCAIYDSRPRTCLTYSCANDRRIWSDFDKMILNPRVTDALNRLNSSDPPLQPHDAPAALQEGMNVPPSNESEPM